MADPPAGRNEFRLDPLTREWVAIVGHRQTRPNLPTTGCPFCVGGLEAPEPYTVRAFTNRWPAFHPGDPIDFDDAARHASGLTALPAVGATEVVLYTPDHEGSLATLGAEGVRAVVDLWAERTEVLLARPEVASVLVFENRGESVGATISHPHGQIYAFPFVPPALRAEATVAAAHGCPLCETLPTELEAGVRMVHEGDEWCAWVPYASGYPYGLLVAPRAHTPSLAACDDRSRDGLAAALVDVVARYDRLFDREFPYLMWIHQESSPPGAPPGAHVHVHFAPPLRANGTQRYVASGEVGSGTLSNPVVPEDAARALREA